MKLKTIEAENLYEALKEISSKTKGVTGYAIAKNMRLLNTELTEYRDCKQKLFKEYGEEKDGKIYVDKSSPDFPKFAKELDKFNNLDVEVELMKVKEEDIVESELTGEQMFMFYDYLIKEGD